MKLSKTEFEGLFILEPNVYEDERGYFFESYNNLKCIDNQVHHVFVQDNESKSSKGTVRGFHFQTPPYAQTKLVRVVNGAVQDVVIDLRQGSSTFGKAYSIELSAENKKQLLIPRGFAHAFLALEDNTIFTYKCDNYYSAKFESGINILNSDIFTDWSLDPSQMKISEKDNLLGSFEDAFKF